MKRNWLFFSIILSALCLAGWEEKMVKQDRFDTAAGPLAITFIGHGSLMLEFGKMVIHIDPFSRVGDYTALPRADLILITHEHGDHLDTKALTAIKKKETVMIYTAKCAAQVSGGQVLANGEKQTVLGIEIEALPAYNIEHKRPDGQPFHPRGDGNGYVLTIGGKRIYIAGDTENIPEMKALKGIDIAFLPMNLPYTMTPEQVAEAARAFRPRILYPYHYGDTDPQLLAELLKAEKDIEVRIRPLS